MNYYKILSILATIVFLAPFPVKAQEKTVANQNWETAFSSSNQGKPGVTKGGASRAGECMAEVTNSKVDLTPILPAPSQSLTSASHPTFLAHVPSTSADKVYLRIKNHNEEYDYATVLPITGQGGIIRLTLPSEAPALEKGQNYQWFLALMCQGVLKPDSPTVEGSLTRVSTKITSSEQIKAMSQLEQAQMYAEAGIWYETISILAQLRKEKSEDSNLFSIWEKVLSSVGLESLVQVELID